MIENFHEVLNLNQLFLKPRQVCIGDLDDMLKLEKPTVLESPFFDPTTHPWRDFWDSTNRKMDSLQLLYDLCDEIA